MKATIDQAGRVVIPKAIPELLGITSGEVDVTADGASIRIEPVGGSDDKRLGRWMVIPQGGVAIGDEDVRSIRDADQR